MNIKIAMFNCYLPGWVEIYLLDVVHSGGYKRMAETNDSLSQELACKV